ncbi:MAG TPA: hypothetical protein VM759_02920 [Longimicrobium sp.]|nr:hypothetical protein [Longimicrobium sp.]
MTIRNYYRAALLLPLAVPAFFSLGLLVEHKPALLDGIMFYLYGSLLFGGIPYVLFAAGFLRWMRGRTAREVRTAILIAPVVYAVVLMLCLLVFLLVDGTLGQNWNTIWSMGGFGVVFGYAYVLLAELGRLILRPGYTLVPDVPAA